MSSNLRKCVSLGAQGGIVPRSMQDYQVQTRYITETNTRWAKLWADWPTLEPNDGEYPEHLWAGLDAQVQRANAEGRRLILTAYRFPLWANQMLEPNVNRWGQGGKDPRFRVPNYVGHGSHWGRFIERLLRRYSPNSSERAGIVHAIEICNEPNDQWFPQTVSSTDGTRTSPTKAAEMLRTAQAIKKRLTWANAFPILLAPGCSDKRIGITGSKETDEWTDHGNFTDLMLDKLQEWTALPEEDPNSFRMQPYTAWSHHNHLDIEHDLAAADLGARRVRDKLAGRSWYSGWENTPNVGNPRVFLTEGGARLAKIQSLYNPPNGAEAEIKQKDLLISNYNKMKSNSPPGVGIEMLTWYLFSSDVSYDTGLRRPVPPAANGSLF
jgi:hypothetical protein